MRFFPRQDAALHRIPPAIRSAIAFIALVIAASATALPASASYPREVILAIAHFNWDCAPDTLIGVVDDNLEVRPTGIFWGGYDTLTAPLCPPDTGIPHPPHHPRYAFTEIELPEWRHLHISTAIDHFNQDTLSDILFFISGVYGDTTAPRDTGRVLAVFGQNGIDTVARIKIDTIGLFQAHPYFAMDFRNGTEFTLPAVRDFSMDTSWVLNLVTLPIPSKAQEQSPTSAVREGSITIFPNPAVSATQVEGRLIPVGDYVVEVISVNGRTERRLDVGVSETGSLFEILDLRGLASGYYLIRLHVRRTGELFGTYPIVVTR